VPRQISRTGGTLIAPERGEQLVWDLPVRLVHWLLATLIAFSWWSVHHHHTDWHIWSGCAILTLLIFRFLWGFFGSSTARWASFMRGPRTIHAYLRGRWVGIGHNPLGALSILALFLAVAVQVGLGLIAQDEDGIYLGPLARLVSSDTSDKARDIHELWFNVILALIVIHLGFASATALASAMIPIIIAVLQSVGTAGINIIGMTMLLQFVVSFGFILVVNAPQNMVAYGTDTFSARDFVRTGLVLTVIALALVMLLAATYWRWLGYV